jgi:hypothetical protein
VPVGVDAGAESKSLSLSNHAPGGDPRSRLAHQARMSEVALLDWMACRGTSCPKWGRVSNIYMNFEVECSMYIEGLAFLACIWSHFSNELKATLSKLSRFRFQELIGTNVVATKLRSSSGCFNAQH